MRPFGRGISSSMGVILDQLVFRELTRRGTTKDKIDKVYDLATETSYRKKLLSIFGLIPEWAGQRRCPFYFDANQVISSYKSISFDDLESQNKELVRQFQILLTHYEGCYSVASYRQAIERQLTQFTTKSVNESYNIAKDLMTCAGAGISQDEVCKEIAMYYCLDELFYNSRYALADGKEIKWPLFFGLANVSRKYSHHSLYRLFESFLLSYEQVLKQREEYSKLAELRSLKRGLSISKQTESADCMWLWSAFQGIRVGEHLEPVHVLTCDIKGAERATTLRRLLEFPINDVTIQKILEREDAFQPGRISVLESNSLTVLREIRLDIPSK